VGSSFVGSFGKAPDWTVVQYFIAASMGCGAIEAGGVPGADPLLLSPVNYRRYAHAVFRAINEGRVCIPDKRPSAARETNRAGQGYESASGAKRARMTSQSS
jgi:hypothetical protein